MSIGSFISGHFLDTMGLYALLALVPIIILYLIRPRPRHQALPSLMFLLKADMKKKHWTFLRYLLQDPLLLLQLLMIIILALALAKPYIMTDTDSSVETQFIIIDASASMGAAYEGTTRLARAKQLAQEALLSSNTIIVASAQASILDEQVTATRAKTLINGIEQTHTPTRLYETINLVNEQASKGDRVVIYSDFQDKDLISVRNLMNAMKAKEIDVVPIAVISDISNVGFIDMSIGSEKTKLTIKNFNNVQKQIQVELAKDNILSITLDPLAQFEQTITTPLVPTSISILEKDDMMQDNIVYISTNIREDIKALYITNKEQKNFKTALGLISGMTLDMQSPPNIFDVEGYDIIIINDVTPNFLLPGTIKKIHEAIEDGATLIIVTQESLFQIELGDLLPISYISTYASSSSITPGTFNRLTENLQFGYATNYYIVTPFDDVSLTVLAQDPAGNPLITLSSYDEGFVFYYGIRDEFSDFAKSPYYPIFWKRVIDYATGMRDLSELNRKTGSVLSNPEKNSVKTPQGSKKDLSILLDYAGFYEFADYTVSANLLDELESSSGILEETTDFMEMNVAEKKKSVEKLLVNIFLIIALVVLFCDLLFIKFRGDI